jgi:TolB-like protein/tetratricopeptide (TPR) repeat protein
MIGKTLGHYQITEKLGEGGMGEVYRATDTKLGRDVALKVLPVEMARSPERLARFQREARAVAALNHPHIVTIFSVEEAEGIHFLTMELVEGQSLDRLIPAQGLPLKRILAIVSALAEALAAAHEKGIVHRDLKPANVMVTHDGRVKVLDFGLAKENRADEPGDSTLTSAGHTEAGVLMGTPAYMSPEQVAGRGVDHRSDIFSLGIVMYEMASGQRPFQGRSSAELASAILRDTPHPLNKLRADLPGDLVRVIRRCLEKDPRHRLQTARDVGNELRDMTRHSAALLAANKPTQSSVPQPGGARDASGAARAEEGFWVAVLPFKHGAANAELTALGEGLSEGIITGLSRFPYLRVIARSSTLRFADKTVDVRAAGKELGARYVMEGSLRRAGSTLRVSAQLVDTSSGAHLWAETYDRPFGPEEIFALQDDLVPRIVSTVADMHGVLPHTMSEAVRSKDIEQLSPYEAVLRSFGYFERLTAEEHAVARTGLERAVQRAPAHADCWAMLSELYSHEYAHGYNLQPDPLGRGLAAARRAVESAPSNHFAYRALAVALFFLKEYKASRNAAERCIALNPMDGDSTAFMGLFIAYAGDWERGLALSEHAKQLNPNHPGWYWFPSFFDAYRKGNYRGALDLALKINMASFWRANMVLAAAYGQLGEREAARHALEALHAVRPDFALVAREELGKWVDPELVEQLMDGLRKAGLEIAGEGGKANRSSS